MLFLKGILGSKARFDMALHVHQLFKSEEGATRDYAISHLTSPKLYRSVANRGSMDFGVAEHFRFSMNSSLS